MEAFGVSFPNPLGLAAGMDKDARALGAWWALGFGFAEVGTLTPRPQVGNPKPRLFRLVEDRALINRMGFNNRGAEEAARRLKRSRQRGLPLPIGVNLGKNRDTPLGRAAEDYLKALRLLEPFGDYFVLNVSSPNTPGLRALQEGPFLDELLARLRPATKKPLLLKVAPDLSPKALDEVLALAKKHRLQGLVAVNTTLAREGLKAPGLRRPGAFGKAPEGEGLGGPPPPGGGRGGACPGERGGRGDPSGPLGEAQGRGEPGPGLHGLRLRGPLFPRRLLLGLLRLMEAEGVSSLGELRRA